MYYRRSANGAGRALAVGAIQATMLGSICDSVQFEFLNLLKCSVADLLDGSPLHRHCQQLLWTLCTVERLCLTNLCANPASFLEQRLLLLGIFQRPGVSNLLLLNTGIWKMLQTYVGHHARGNVCSDAPPAPGLSRSVLVHVLRRGRAGLCVCVCACACLCVCVCVCVCVCLSVKTMAPAPTFPMSPRPSQLRIMTRFLEARSKG